MTFDEWWEKFSYDNPLLAKYKSYFEEAYYTGFNF